MPPIEWFRRAVSVIIGDLQQPPGEGKLSPGYRFRILIYVSAEELGLGLVDEREASLAVAIMLIGYVKPDTLGAKPGSVSLGTPDLSSQVLFSCICSELTPAAPGEFCRK